MIAEKTAATKMASSKIEDLQNRLDARTEANAAAGTRHERRWSYRHSNINTTVEHPGGGVAHITSHSRLLWSDGIALICAGFSYPGSSYSVTLISKDGESMMVKGEVTCCRHVEGVFHEVEVKFNQRLDPHLFIKLDAGSAADMNESVELDSLRGKLLHLDDSEADLRLLAHYLRESSIEFKPTQSPDEALSLLKTAVYDIFLCDLNLGKQQNGLTVIRKAREDGFSGPIVVLTAESNPAKIAEVKAAGTDIILRKPYQRSELIQLMVKLHQQVGALGSGEAIYSTLGDQPEFDELLTSYVTSVRQLVQEMQTAIAAKDMDAVREYCLNIQGAASGYGFASFGTAAQEALRAIDSTMSIDESKAQLRALALMCGQLTLRNGSGGEKSGTERLVY